MTGVGAAIDMQRLAGDENCCLEVEHRFDNFRDCTHAVHGMQRREEGCIGVLMMPGDTAFTRMPLPAYSIASDRVTASSPPW
jgi:hypothetical protein